MSDAEIIEVVQAHKEGKKIQCKDEHWKEWEAVSPRDRIPWNFQIFTYRVVPEPRAPREWTLMINTDGNICGPSYGVTYNTEKVRVREVI